MNDGKLRLINKLIEWLLNSGSICFLILMKLKLIAQAALIEIESKKAIETGMEAINQVIWRNQSNNKTFI